MDNTQKQRLLNDIYFILKYIAILKQIVDSLESKVNTSKEQLENES